MNPAPDAEPVPSPPLRRYLRHNRYLVKYSSIWSRISIAE